jgi:hypothetical protein
VQLVFIMKKRVFVVSGLPATGKTELSKALAKKLDACHTVFLRKIAGRDTGTVLAAIKRIALLGQKKARSIAMKQSLEEFLQTGKTTLIIDGAFGPEEVETIKQSGLGLEIKTIFLHGKRKQRISFAQLRRPGKGGGSRAWATAWITAMDLLHNKLLGVDLQEMKKQSDVVIEKKDETQQAFLERAIKRILG